MPRPEPTEIRIDEHGDEEHESWVLVRAGRVSCSPPGANLFDSEIWHQHYIHVVISRCTRKRDLNRDWLYAKKTLCEVSMSEAQWGAFVSSFGNGTGVPATLDYFNGEQIPHAPVERRLDASHKEVKQAGARALQEVQEAYAAVQEAFDNKLGVREMRERLNTLKHRLGNAPSNMEFAAKSLTEHVENVVTKARADIEGMALMAVQQGQLPEGAPLLLTTPDEG